MKKRLLFFILGITSFSNLNQLNTVNASSYFLPGGENVAIEVKAAGLLVTGTYDLITPNGTYNPSKDNDILRGDLIYEVNDTKISSINDLPSLITDKTKDEYNLPVKLYRNHESYDKILKLIKIDKDGNLKTGLLVKDRILGIGTVSIYNTKTNSYAALGHQFVDNDFSNVVELTTGNIYDSEVVGIRKSSNGTPGEKVAQINEKMHLGTIIKNNSFGIYGQVNKLPNKKPMAIKKQEDVKIGPAEIYTVMKNKTIGKYKIKIISLKKQESIQSKGITFEIVDKDLLNMSNGIIQGMSGSTIVQDNKIVGAVTHVLVDDVKKGYGIYIEWMIQEMS